MTVSIFLIDFFYLLFYLTCNSLCFAPYAKQKFFSAINYGFTIVLLFPLNFIGWRSNTTKKKIVFFHCKISILYVIVFFWLGTFILL